MTVLDIWNDIDIKLIAILRGIKSEETKECVIALLDAGFRAVEIPLNSPDVYSSIRIAVETGKQHSDKPCLIGAGTVLKASEVEQVQLAGGNLIVSPNVNAQVIEKTKILKMFSAPGVYTPTECLAALEYGADILKVFPASMLDTSGIKALSAVLPKATQICAVGGAGDNDFKRYLEAGVVGFGLGSSLYKQGISIGQIFTNARSAIEAYKACHSHI